LGYTSVTHGKEECNGVHRGWVTLVLLIGKKIVIMVYLEVGCTSVTRGIEECNGVPRGRVTLVLLIGKKSVIMVYLEAELHWCNSLKKKV